MKKLLSLVTICLFLTSCGSTSFSVTMREAYESADPVTITVTIGGPQYSDLTFSIHGIEYHMTAAPTVSAPVFTLDTTEKDGMQSVALHMQKDAASVTELHMLPEEGNERVYTALDADAFTPLLDWAGQN